MKYFILFLGSLSSLFGITNVKNDSPQYLVAKVYAQSGINYEIFEVNPNDTYIWDLENRFYSADTPFTVYFFCENGYLYDLHSNIYIESTITVENSLEKNEECKKIEINYDIEESSINIKNDFSDRMGVEIVTNEGEIYDIIFLEANDELTFSTMSSFSSYPFTAYLFYADPLKEINYYELIGIYPEIFNGATVVASDAFISKKS